MSLSPGYPHEPVSWLPAWLNAFPMSSLGLCMDDEVIRVVIGLCLGVSLCLPHECQPCGARVKHLGTRGLHCGKSMGRHPCPAVHDLIKRSLAVAKISAHLERRISDALEELTSACMGCHLLRHICVVSLAVGCHGSRCSGRLGRAEENGQIHHPPLYSGGY